jgi:putative ABC transport system permease protein
MQSLFGIPMAGLAVSLFIIVAAMGAVLGYLALRNRLLFKMAVRNIPRRRAQTVLIIFGLTLSTTIISAALAIGDTVNNSIRGAVIEALGDTDVRLASPQLSAFGDVYLPVAAADDVRAAVAGDPRVDGVLPELRETLPVTHPVTGLTEARTLVIGFDAGSLTGFNNVVSSDGRAIDLGALGAGRVVVNADLADALDAKAGDQVEIVTPAGRGRFTIDAVAARGGLAGSQPRLLLRLEELQEAAGRAGQINTIEVSTTSAGSAVRQASEEVGDDLRLKFTRQESAQALFDGLRDPAVIAVIEESGNPDSDLPRGLKADLTALAQELRGATLTDEFRELIADTAVAGAVFAALERADRLQLGLTLAPAFSTVQVLSVSSVKADALDLAELIGNFVTTFFAIFGSFSIIVGLLLIFLVFVLLAASRTTELGISRAIGMKRRHLVQMFTMEGFAYASISALIGTVLGVLASLILVQFLVSAVAAEDDGFTISYSVTLTSLVAAFSMGLLITALTVIFSAWRVSKLNIVVAIRGLAQELARKERAAWFRLLRGILVTVVGLLIAQSGVSAEQAAPFTLGVSVFLVGLSMLLRQLLRRRRLREETETRIVYTFLGASLLLFWSLPFDALESVTGELKSNVEMFILTGVWMVAAATWLVVHNAEVVLWVMDRTLGRFGRLKPVLKLAVAYPVSARFRTGLTVAMFALVVFTLMIFAILNSLGSVAVDEPERVTGGYDIVATTGERLPVPDMAAAVAASPLLAGDRFEVVAGQASLPAEARQVGAAENRFQGVEIRVNDDAYLRSTQLRVTHYDPAYGTTARELWDAVAGDPDLAIASSSVLPVQGGGFGDFAGGFEVEGIKINEPGPITAFDIDLRPPLGQGQQAAARLKVIAILDQFADSLEQQGGPGEEGDGGPGAVPGPVIYAAVPAAAAIGSRDLAFTTYKFRLADPSTSRDVASRLETVFIDNGMVAESTTEQIADSQAQSNAFTRLFQGFMGLGLVVGVASLGVISFRAVVERRQSIGMLRAMGFRANMVRAQFLIESTFVTLLGIALGLGLGTVISWNIVNEIGTEIEGLKFTIPWLQVASIVGITLVFSLLTTWAPASQAAKIYPSEALRYE